MERDDDITDLLDGWPASFEMWQMRFLQWLDGDSWSHDEILSWMEGFQLPAEDPTVEPYVWLVRAIPSGRHRNERLKCLAERIRHVMDGVSPAGGSDVPGQALSNLLQLCAAVDQPDELAEPLDRLLRRFGRGALDRDNLTGALRAALIWNQKDARWLSLWKKLVNTDPGAPLRGTRADGLEGILLMPRPTGPRETAALREIGWALGTICKWLDTDIGDPSRREQRFYRLLQLVVRRRPQLDDEVLSYMKLAYSWPIWTGQLVTELSAIAVARGFLLQYFGDVSPAEADEAIGEAGLSMLLAGYQTSENLKGVAEHLLRQKGKIPNEQLELSQRTAAYTCSSGTSI